MLHAARKVFSNVKTTLAKEWSPLANETLNPIKPDDVYRIDFNRLNELEKKTNFIQIWNQHRLFNSPDDAKVFLGVLDAVFMFSYAVVRKSKFENKFNFNDFSSGSIYQWYYW